MQLIQIPVICGTSGAYCTIATPSSAPPFDRPSNPLGTKCLTLPPRSPNLNAYSERWVRSAKEECLRKLILFGEGSLRRATAEYVSHFHGERNHQGKGNVLLFPSANSTKGTSHVIQRNQRLGGLLSYYSRANKNSPYEIKPGCSTPKRRK